MNIIEMEKTPLLELRARAKEMGIPRASRLKKEDLIMRIRQGEADKEGLKAGHLRIRTKESDSCVPTITKPGLTTSTSPRPRSAATACATAT